MATMTNATVLSDAQMQMVTGGKKNDSGAEGDATAGGMEGGAIGGMVGGPVGVVVGAVLGTLVGWFASDL